MGKKIALILLISLFASANCQGEECTTPNNLQGRCRFLFECSFLVNLYRSNPSRNNINYIVASQRICGNRSQNNKPIVCCADEYLLQATTQTPPSAAPQNVSDVSSKSTKPKCKTPDGVPGECTALAQCPAIFEEVKEKGEDPILQRYIQKSNEICNKENEVICCPTIGTEPDPEIVDRIALELESTERPEGYQAPL